MELQPQGSDTFEQVLRWVRVFCKPPVDQESLTQEIILENFQNQRPITIIAIKHRCFDELRRLKRELQANQQASEAADHRNGVPVLDDLDNLLGNCDLTVLEREVIILKHSFEFDFQQIARSLSVEVRDVSNAHWSGMEKLGETRRRLYG